MCPVIPVEAYEGFTVQAKDTHILVESQRHMSVTGQPIYFLHFIDEKNGCWEVSDYPAKVHHRQGGKDCGIKYFHQR